MSTDLHCPNCGAPVSGPFCSQCGQKDQPLRQSTLHFLRQALNEYFGVDGRLWVTLRLLIFRPGRLTAQHLLGRRRRYLAPLRLYLFATILFFSLLSLLDPAKQLERQLGGPTQDSTTTVEARLDDIQREILVITQQISEASDASAARNPRSDSLRPSDLDEAAGAISVEPELRGESDAPFDASERQSVLTDSSLALQLSIDRLTRRRLQWQESILETYPPDSTIRPADLIDAAELLYRGEIKGIEVSGLGDDGFRRGPLYRLTQSRTRSETAAALSDLVRSMIERIPVVMFLMLPVFALLMKLAYVRRGWFYSEHLVFALHNHAVAFMGFAIIAILVAVAGNTRWVTWSAAGIIASLNAYYLVALKHVYGQGWIKTGLKYALLFVSYWGIILFIGFTILVLLGGLFD